MLCLKRPSKGSKDNFKNKYRIPCSVSEASIESVERQFQEKLNEANPLLGLLGGALRGSRAPHLQTRYSGLRHGQARPPPNPMGSDSVCCNKFKLCHDEIWKYPKIAHGFRGMRFEVSKNRHLQFCQTPRKPFRLQAGSHAPRKLCRANARVTEVWRSPFSFVCDGPCGFL
jgi:hypothetical protein